MNNKTRLAYFSVILLSVSFGFVSLVAFAKNDNDKAQSQENKTQGSQKQSVQVKAMNKTIDFKNFEKAFEYFKKAKILGADPVYCKNEIIFASRKLNNKAREELREQFIGIYN